MRYRSTLDHPEHDGVAASLSAGQEWQTMWPLPLVSMLGISGAAMFAYSNGVFMEDITASFGWSRAAFSSAFVLQMLLGLFILPTIGRLTDRFGPRRIALIGLATFPISFAVLGLVGQTIWQWWAYCALAALGQGFIAQTVWISAVAGRFHASRGLAMAVALCGLGVGSLIWPLLAAIYLETVGWRLAFSALAATWLVVTSPLVVLFFRDDAKRASNARPVAPQGRHYRRALFSSNFIGLVIAGGLYSSAYFGLTVHLVPILRGNGMVLTTAASIAGLTGAFAMIGRLVTGQLLDRFDTRLVAAVTFVLPAISSVIIMVAESSVPLTIVAIAILGLSAGAEIDIVTYVVAKRFSREIFGSIYSISTAILALCASSGPLLAGLIYDADKNYSDFLMIIIPMVLSGSVLMTWTLGPSPKALPHTPVEG